MNERSAKEEQHDARHPISIHLVEDADTAALDIALGVRIARPGVLPSALPKRPIQSDSGACLIHDVEWRLGCSAEAGEATRAHYVAYPRFACLRPKCQPDLLRERCGGT